MNISWADYCSVSILKVCFHRTATGHKSPETNINTRLCGQMELEQLSKCFCSESEVAQSCPTLRDPMDYILPGSSVHGIFQGRVLEWVAISFSRGSSRQGLNPGLPHCRQTLYPLSHQGTHLN